MRLPTSIPKRMPTDWVLKQIAFPPPPSSFAPFRTLDGEMRSPRISQRNQARIRKACLLAGLDPVKVVGLPPADIAAEAKKSVYKMPKGSKKEMQKFEREKKIAENMSRMDDKIAAWKEERRKARDAKKPDMPF
ncbi:hypothetical protein HDU67_008379 [Dinochytrium kinnereticum]|nr:hypothetical protein HDU67_008379 [Dinochytrium kinnereticum]